MMKEEQKHSTPSVSPLRFRVQWYFRRGAEPVGLFAAVQQFPGSIIAHIIAIVPRVIAIVARMTDRQLVRC